MYNFRLIPEISAIQKTNEIFIENIKTLTSRVDKLESQLHSK